jgi:hypothetical protein
VLFRESHAFVLIGFLLTDSFASSFGIATQFCSCGLDNGSVLRSLHFFVKTLLLGKSNTGIRMCFILAIGLAGRKASAVAQFGDRELDTVFLDHGVVGTFLGGDDQARSGKQNGKKGK